MSLPRRPYRRPVYLRTLPTAASQEDSVATYGWAVQTCSSILSGVIGIAPFRRRSRERRVRSLRSLINGPGENTNLRGGTAPGDWREVGLPATPGPCRSAVTRVMSCKALRFCPVDIEGVNSGRVGAQTFGYKKRRDGSGDPPDRKVVTTVTAL